MNPLDRHLMFFCGLWSGVASCFAAAGQFCIAVVFVGLALLFNALTDSEDTPADDADC